MTYHKRFTSLKAARSWGNHNMGQMFVIAKVRPGQTLNDYHNKSKSIHWVIRFDKDSLSLFSDWTPNS